MTNLELVEKAKQVVSSYKTVYMYGTFGMPVSESLIQQKQAQYPGYYSSANMAVMRTLIGKGFGFDCVGLIKGLLWGWSGNLNLANGGATYGGNGVPDISANSMIAVCAGVSTSFADIEVGEVVWLSGHIGIYIGDGKVIESTPSWDNGVQITACKNMGTISGLNARAWTSHGKLPYITYEAAADSGGTGTDTGATPDAGDADIDSAVQFTGGHVYVSSTATTPATSKEKGESLCEITDYRAGVANPYHLVSTDGGGIHGWVKAASIALPDLVGKMVYIIGTHYATGEAIPDWVKAEPRIVSKVADGKALIDHPDGINSWVHLADIKVA